MNASPPARSYRLRSPLRTRRNNSTIVPSYRSPKPNGGADDISVDERKRGPGDFAPVPSAVSFVAKSVLLHEMAHIKLHPYRKHGKRFNAEMLKLAEAGAFNDLW